ncbi:MAG TPA: DUF998 domain-containing protein [Mucilaginibacter sp.]
MDRSGHFPPKVILRTFWHTALLFCGILGPLIFLIVYFTFGQVSPDFDMLRQPIGRLELMKYGWIQSVNFIVFGLFIIAFAFGLRIELKAGFAVNLLPLSQIFIALGMILLGLFIHEPDHTYASMISSAALIISLLLFARRFAVDIRWRGWATSTALCAISITTLIACFWYAGKLDSPYAGVFEHLVVVVHFTWLIAFDLTLLWGRRLAPVSR